MKSKRIVPIFLSVLLCVFSSGCLSLQFGTKTHNCSGTKEAELRIAQLEKRINTLEQYAGISSPPSVSLASATVDSQGSNAIYGFRASSSVAPLPR